LNVAVIGSCAFCKRLFLKPSSNHRFAFGERFILLGIEHSKGETVEWRASHILVKDRSLAEDILKRIKQGARLESLAREFSTCPSKSSGGDLGWFGPGKMVAPFESAVRRISPGSVGSDVVQTQFGYHIIKCTGRKD
jgi:peptidyl-prolyl cis-trans isomerase C